MSFRRKAEQSVRSLENTVGSNFIYIDEISDNVTINNCKISLSIFLRLGMKASNFTNSSFTQSEFRNCYFRKCNFRLVDFTGSTFIDCNFEKATFDQCCFKFAQFHNCIIDGDEIAKSLPIEPNLRLSLTRNLRCNFQQICDKDSAELFLEIGMNSEEALYKAIIIGESAYYRSNYDVVSIDSVNKYSNIL